MRPLVQMRFGRGGDPATSSINRCDFAGAVPAMMRRISPGLHLESTVPNRPDEVLRAPARLSLTVPTLGEWILLADTCPEAVLRSCDTRAPSDLHQTVRS